jgi:hypothetical protein
MRAIRGTLRTIMTKHDEDQWGKESVAAMLMNPFYAITISEDLLGDHRPMVSQDQWVAANVQLIEQLGSEVYLRQLLTVLGAASLASQSKHRTRPK